MILVIEDEAVGLGIEIYRFVYVVWVTGRLLGVCRLTYLRYLSCNNCFKFKYSTSVNLVKDVTKCKIETNDILM